MIDIPFLITANLKIICFAILGLFLLLQWLHLNKKYTSDLPFLIGLSYLFFIPGMIIDILYSLDIVSLGFIFNIRYSLDIISIMLFFGALLSVWLNRFTKLRYIIIILLTIIFVIITMLMPSNNSLIYLDIIHIIISLPAIIIGIITFLFTYYSKRLSNVNGLFISIGLIIVLISQIIRPTLKIIAISSLMPSGLAWLTNIIQILGWITMYFGFKSKT